MRRRRSAHGSGTRVTERVEVAEGYVIVPRIALKTVLDAFQSRDEATDMFGPEVYSLRMALAPS